MERPKFDPYGRTQWDWLCRYNQNLSLGNNTQIGAGTVIDAYKGVAILNDAKIGFNVVILSYSSIDNQEGAVIIKKGACIGSGSVIMPGVTIGEGAKVGALSFVNKDVPAGETWVGIPARELVKPDKGPHD